MWNAPPTVTSRKVPLQSAASALASISQEPFLHCDPVGHAVGQSALASSHQTIPPPPAAPAPLVDPLGPVAADEAAAPPAPVEPAVALPFAAAGFGRMSATSYVH